MTNIIRFKRDTSFRHDLFTPESVAHPAKCDSQLLIWIVEKFTNEGETILDPMFGSGTTMLACILGRNVIGVELEQKFVDMAKANWEKVRQRPQLGYPFGECVILQGDARDLSGLLADKCIFSPPYGNPRDIAEKAEREYEDKRLGKQDKQHGRTQFRGRYEVDAILTSPPYESSVTGKDGIDWSKGTRQNSKRYGYLKPRDRSKKPVFDHLSIGGAGFNYTDAKDNIGNLKTTDYLSAMKTVYEQCYHAIRPGGLCILITKNFIRNQKEVRLDSDTISLCESVGFSFQERWYRELPAQSFWRILYKKRFPDAPELKYEDVLVLQKEE